jgi:Abortive infection C-terminus
MLLFSEQEFAAGGHGNLDADSIVMVTSRQATSQHSETIFKQILGGCTAVVEGLGALRNKLGDSHGKGPNRAKPYTRHAELAVNLAGSMATFLIETWEHRKS